jgi:hypothetical protein
MKKTMSGFPAQSNLRGLRRLIRGTLYIYETNHVYKASDISDV